MSSATAIVLPHDVAERVLRELQTVWDQIGLAEAERAATVTQLSDQVRRMFEDKLAEEKSKLQSLREDIQKKLAAISNLELSVGVDLKGASTSTEAKNLSEQKASLDEVEGKLLQMRRDRLNCITSLHAQLMQHWQTLGGPVEAADEQRFGTVDESRLGEDRILAYQAAVREAEAEIRQRTAAAQEAEAEIVELRSLLAVAAPDTMPAAPAPDGAGGAEAAAAAAVPAVLLPISRAALAAQQTTLEWLRRERGLREAQIKDLARRISPLWDLLGVTLQERQAFFDAHGGLGTEVIAACELELSRLERLKAERMAAMVREAEDRLAAAWAELHTGRQPPRVPKDVEPNSEAALAFLKAQTTMVEALVVAARPVLALIQRRAAILATRAEYEDIIADPTRLMGRGPEHREKLKREQALREDLEVKLPKLEAKLVAALEAFAQEQGAPLMYEGADMLERIRDELNERKREKEDARARKEQAKRLESEAAKRGVMQPPPPLEKRPSSAVARTASKTPRKDGGLGTGSSSSTSSTAAAAAAGAAAAALGGAVSAVPPASPRTPSRPSSASITLRETMAATAGRVPLSPRNQSTRKLSFTAPAAAKGETPAAEAHSADLHA